MNFIEIGAGPMNIYPELFLSPWHLIALSLTLIAFIALVVGGYERKTILRSSAMSFLFFYGISLLVTGSLTQEQKYIEEVMLERLDQRYEDTIKDVTLAPGERKQIDKRYTLHRSETIRYQYQIQPSE